MEAKSSMAEVNLEVSCHLAEDSLRISYVLHNAGKVPLIAYDGVTDEGEWPDLNWEVYVSYHTPSELQLKRIRPAGPKGKRVTYAVVPLVSSTMPGQKRQVRFSLALPVTEFNVNFPPDSSVAQYALKRAEKVTLTVGYFWQQEGTELEQLEQNPHIFQLTGRMVDQLFVTAACAVPVQVKVRTDAIFERQ